MGDFDGIEDIPYDSDDSLVDGYTYETKKIKSSFGFTYEYIPSEEFRLGEGRDLLSVICIETGSFSRKE